MDIRKLELDWIYCRNNWTRAEKRDELASELREIRRIKGNKVAKAFVDQLIWIGVYPAWVFRQFPR